MSAIGGIVTPSTEVAKTDTMLRMSRALLLRGGENREAYVHRGVGMFYHRAPCDRERERQPLTRSKNGQNYSIVVDGEIEGRGEFSGVSVGMGVDSGAELALESYFAFGGDFADSLGGSYALALSDEDRREVILARDGGGRRPLFYVTEGDRMAFASEIKGVLRALEGSAVVDLGRLRAHWLSPCGSFSGESLYRDVFSLPAGWCGVWSGMGLSLYPQGEAPLCQGKTVPRGVVVSPPAICPDEKEMEALLSEILFAFDYPQFDCLMPSVLFVAREAKKRKKRTVYFEDGTLCMSLDYARERVDRLSSLSGITLHSVSPRGNLVSDREFRGMDRLLCEMVKKLDRELLCRLFGAGFERTVEAEKNVAKRIRMRAILWQSVLWAESYPILFL